MSNKKNTKNTKKVNKKVEEEIEDVEEVEEDEEEIEVVEKPTTKKPKSKLANKRNVDLNELSDKELREMYGEKSTFQKVMNVILWIVLFAWMIVCLVDFFRVHKEKDPVFCIAEGTTKYEDGNVDWCLGAGYKIYQYNRKSFKAIEYGPFWINDRSAEEENE